METSVTVPKNFEPSPEDVLPDSEPTPFEDDETAAYDKGIQAGLAGEPNDDTKSEAW
jgi:hypothetical protein